MKRLRINFIVYEDDLNDREFYHFADFALPTFSGVDSVVDMQLIEPATVGLLWQLQKHLEEKAVKTPGKEAAR